MTPFTITLMWRLDQKRPERALVTLSRPRRFDMDLGTFPDPYEAAGYVKRWFDGRGITFRCDIDEAQRKDVPILHFWPDQEVPVRRRTP